MAELRDFLSCDVLAAAPKLLGCRLIRGEREALIVEVEAYRGTDDPGCHAFYGRTPRTEIMFGPPGLAYVYFTYGVHWMLNIVAHEEGDAAAVLIRAAVPASGVDEMVSLRVKNRRNKPPSYPKHEDEDGVVGGAKPLRPEELLSGPGKIAQAFEVDRRDYGRDLLDAISELRIEPGVEISEVLVGPRVGLARGKGDELPWRFASADHREWLSPPRNRWSDRASLSRFAKAIG